MRNVLEDYDSVCTSLPHPGGDQPPNLPSEELVPLMCHDTRAPILKREPDGLHRRASDTEPQGRNSLLPNKRIPLTPLPQPVRNMFVIKTRVGPSTIHGIGVFACDDVPAGGVVWRFHPPFDQVLSQLDIAGLPEIAREYLRYMRIGVWILAASLSCPAITPVSLITAMTRTPKSARSCRSHAGRSFGGGDNL